MRSEFPVFFDLGRVVMFVVSFVAAGACDMPPASPAMPSPVAASAALQNAGGRASSDVRHGESDKTFVCHITGEDELADGTPLLVGHVIHVSNNAVDAHCLHGDGDHNPDTAKPDRGQRVSASQGAGCAWYRSVEM